MLLLDVMRYTLDLAENASVLVQTFLFWCHLVQITMTTACKFESCIKKLTHLKGKQNTDHRLKAY